MKQKVSFIEKANQNIGSAFVNGTVPITALMSEIIPELCRVPYDYLYRDDAVAMAECSLLVQEYLDIDMVFANRDIYALEGEAMGAELRFFPDHCPDYVRSNPLIRDERDLDKIKFHGLESGRFPYLLEYCRAYKRFTGLDHFPQISAPWTLAANLCGVEELVMAAIEDPEFVHEVMRRVVDDFQVPMLRALAEVLPGFTQITMADAFGSVPIVDNHIIDEFIRPYLERELEKLNMPGVTLFDTSYFGASKLEGAKRKHFEDFSIWANQWYLCIDPDLEALGIEYARRVADEHKTVLHAGVGAKMMETYTPEQIVNRIKGIMLGGKRGSSPMFFLFNDLTTNTPLENIHAAVQAVRIYGAPEADDNTAYEAKKHVSFEEFIRTKRQENTEHYEFNWLDKSKLFV